MDAILLAGGYATRLYPLTKDRPKALLPVGGRAILDYVVDSLDAAAEIGRMFLVTNAKFASHFSGWAQRRALNKPLQVLDDGTTSNEARLGAIGDVRFVLDNADVDTREGLFVLGTDNLARFDIIQVVRLGRARRSSAVFAVHEHDPRRLRRMGVALLSGDERVLDFEEKPAEPKSDLVVPPFYVYSPEAVALVRRYLEEGNNPDAPGHFIAWLYRRSPVYACVTDGGVQDIGTPESYEAVCRQYEKKA